MLGTIIRTARMGAVARREVRTDLGDRTDPAEDFSPTDRAAVSSLTGRVGRLAQAATTARAAHRDRTALMVRQAHRAALTAALWEWPLQTRQPLRRPRQRLLSQLI